MKKIFTIIGARPQFIKSAPVSKVLRKNFNEIIVHTGQHYDRDMSEIFFHQLGLDSNFTGLNVGSGSHSSQTANILIKLEQEIQVQKPDAVLVYGDTNSTLAGAMVAAKEHIPLFHVEAGLRSYNKTMPEELNRIATDHFSDLLLCPTQTAVENLKKESLINGVHLTGDVMLDACLTFSRIQAKQNLPEEYILLTLHRPQNVDHGSFLKNILSELNKRTIPTIFPCHPRTRQKALEIIEENKLKNIKLITPFGYIEMLDAIKRSNFVITDSGGLQKETMFLKKACITTRPDTEWVETIQFGWNKLVDQNIPLLNKTIDNIENYDKNDCNLFGDGDASEKILNTIKQFFK